MDSLLYFSDVGHQSVSVILPFYNAESTLKLAIESVLAQSAQINKLILVNNNATDGSVSVAKTFANSKAHIELVEEPVQGVVHAMNRGIKEVDPGCHWIARMDADDQWYPTKLAKQLEFAAIHPDCEIIATQVDYEPGQMNQSDGFRAYVNWNNKLCSLSDIARNIFVESPLINPSVLIRTKLFGQLGDYRQGDFPEDYEFFLRAHQEGIKMGKVPEKLVKWKDGQDRLSRSNPAYSKAAFERIKMQYLIPFLQTRLNKRPLWVWGDGRKARPKIEGLNEAGLKVSAVVGLKKERKMDWPYVHFSCLETEYGPYVLSFVSNRGAGEEIRKFLLTNGRREIEDFLIAG